MKIQPQKRQFGLPKEWHDRVIRPLHSDPDFTDDKKQWAKWILELSDIYISHSVNRHKIWQKKQLYWAYQIYFLPLNYLRLLAVFNDQSVSPFLQGFNQIFDFGSGSGVFQLAYSESFPDSGARFTNIEIEQVAIESHKRLLSSFELSAPVNFVHQTPDQIKPDSLLTASYSLNELENWSELWLKYQNILIVEPSTQFDSRKLMTFRNMALKQGFKAIGPCTHQAGCPLLLNSKKDWCHLSLEFNQPDWWKELEFYLPIKNQVLTYSYLFLSQNLSPELTDKSVRVIGDPQKEKGKTKQLICRNQNREFLSWLKRDKINISISRGDLIYDTQNLSVNGSEVRLKTSPE